MPPLFGATGRVTV